MLRHIKTHISEISLTEDVYNEEGKLLFTVHHVKSEEDKEYIIDYVRSHIELNQETPLDAYRELCKQALEKEISSPKTAVSLKEKRNNDPKWFECKEAAKLLLRKGMRSQVKNLLREYNRGLSKV
ncbi:MAG: hypothetical protein IJY92_00105 [Alphaproteobacteria bacterium]|nr:hypothetical protein [Alphaproteobacteria bacterium]